MATQPPKKRRKLDSAGCGTTRKELEKRMNDLKRRGRPKSLYNPDFLVRGDPTQVRAGCGGGGGGSSSSGFAQRGYITTYGTSSSSGGGQRQRVKPERTADDLVTDEFFAGLMSPVQQNLRRAAYNAFVAARTHTVDSAELPMEEEEEEEEKCTDMVVAGEAAPRRIKTIFITTAHHCDPKCHYKPVGRNACGEYYQKHGVMIEDLRAGNVYACVDSGKLHVCTPDLCDAQAPANGYPTCWKTGAVFNSPILTPSKEFFGDSPMPTSAQRAWMDRIARNQCEQRDPLGPPAKVRTSTGNKRKRQTEDPSAKKFEQARKIVRVLVYTIPGGAKKKHPAHSEDIVNQYAEIVMRMWNFSLMSPHNIEREHANEQQRKSGSSTVKFKRDSLTMKFPQFVFASLYTMRHGYEIRPSFTPSQMSRANGLSERLTTEFIDDHRICFLLRDEYLEQQLVAANKLPASRSVVNDVYIDRKYINAGRKLMRVCFGSYLVSAVDELVDSELQADDAIAAFEAKLAGFSEPMNASIGV